MTKYYKLTDQNMQTFNGFQWKLGKWVEAVGLPDQELCTNSWLHCYDSPLLAVLHNPMHARIEAPRLFEIEVGGKTKDDNGLKRGFQKMRLMKELVLPVVTQEQRIKYGILCAKAVYTDVAFARWANRWLSGKDRTIISARAVWTAARATATAAEAARATAWTTARATAATAARTAAEAAGAAARAAAWASTAAWATARAAAWTAAAAAEAAGAAAEISLIEFAELAITE